MVNVTRGGIEQDSNDVVLNVAQTFGTFPALTVFQQVGLSFNARRSKLCLEHLRHRGAKDIAVAGVLIRQRFDVA